MHYLKRNTKYSILAFLVIVLSITVSISTHAKTEVYFSLYDNPQILSITSLKLEVQTINTNSTSQDELINILKNKQTRSEVIDLRDSKIGGFKEPKNILQLRGLPLQVVRMGKKMGYYYIKLAEMIFTSSKLLIGVYDKS